MDKISKLKNQKEIETYLEEKCVYDIFEDLLKKLMINKPENPINYLVDALSEVEGNNILKLYFSLLFQ